MLPEGARTGERRSRPRESRDCRGNGRGGQPHHEPLPRCCHAPGAPRGGSEAIARRRRGASGEDVFPRLRIALGAAHPRGCSPRAAGHGSRPLGTSTRPVQRRLPSPGIRAAGTTPAVTGTAQPAEPRPGVPARAGVRWARGARTSEAVCQAEIRRRKSEESRGKFPRPALRQLLRRGATTPSGPAGDFHLLQGAGKAAAHESRRLPSSLTGKRKAPLGVPTPLEYPHRADPAPSLSLAHTRAGTGRTPQQSARGGRGAPPPRSPPSAAGCPETPPPAARLLSPPPFPPGLMDESRMLREPAFPLGRRRERERAPGTAGRVLRARPGTVGGSPSPQGRAGATGAYCKESLLQIRSFKVSRLSGGIGFLLGSPPSWYKTYPLAHSLAKRPQATFILSLFVFPTSKPACISRCADGRHPGGLDNS